MCGRYDQKFLMCGRCYQQVARDSRCGLLLRMEGWTQAGQGIELKYPCKNNG